MEKSVPVVQCLRYEAGRPWQTAASSRDGATVTGDARFEVFVAQ